MQSVCAYSNKTNPRVREIRISSDVNRDGGRAEVAVAPLQHIYRPMGIDCATQQSACAVIAPDEQLQLRQLFDAQVADASTRRGSTTLIVAKRDDWVPHAICGRCCRAEANDIPVMVLEDGEP